MTALALLLALVVPAFTPQPIADPPVHEAACFEARTTGYVRGHHSPWTADGTSIWTPEPIAAASYDLPLGAYVWVEGVGTVRIADRGRLGSGNPTWIDVAVYSTAEAYALTGTRLICVMAS